MHATITEPGRNAKGRFTPRIIEFDFGPEIDRGTALLNAEVPGWFNDIDLVELDLESGTTCVLGQLAMSQFSQRLDEYKKRTRRYPGQGYYAVAEMLWGADAEFTEACAYGFNVDYELGRAMFGYTMWNKISKQAWEQLTMAWQERIEKLRADAGTIL